MADFREFAEKMKARNASEAAIRAFQHTYQELSEGKTGLMAEADIDPVKELPTAKEVATTINESLIAQTVVVKLNGGLGTSMGLERAKSLLPIKGPLTFLDLCIQQILRLREQAGVPVRFLLMNSPSTSEDTQKFLEDKYPHLGPAKDAELLQNYVPKVDAETLRPVVWPPDPKLEWCPPGHGDIYSSLLGSGWLDKLLAEGVRYLFVSNSDNLGASLDLGLLTYFASLNKPFLMEVTRRTESDRKGGHLATRGGQLLLRESAQCPKQDSEAFQDIERHRFFNTNNIWLNLEQVRAALRANDGFLKLPLIKNSKTVDPRDASSPRVFQLETAMGAAIECFEDADAIDVPRSRFAPVKTIGDLLAVRSDAYNMTEDWLLGLAPESGEKPPTIDLDSDIYKVVEDLDALGLPSLKACRKLKVRGRMTFETGVVLQGNVEITSQASGRVPAGVHKDVQLNLT